MHFFPCLGIENGVMDPTRAFLDLFLEDQMELLGSDTETWILLGTSTYTRLEWISKKCKTRCFVAFSDAEAKEVLGPLQKQQQEVIPRNQDQKTIHTVDLAFRMDSKSFRPQKLMAALHKSLMPPPPLVAVTATSPEMVMIGISDLDEYWPEDRDAFDVLVAASQHARQLVGFSCASRWSRLWSFLEASGRFQKPRLCSIESWTRVWMNTEDTPKGFTRLGLKMYSSMTRQAIHREFEIQKKAGQDRLCFTLLSSWTPSSAAAGPSSRDHRIHLK